MDEVNKREIPEEIRQKIEDDFEVEYTYDMLALSGSSLRACLVSSHLCEMVV